MNQSINNRSGGFKISGLLFCERSILCILKKYLTSSHTLGVSVEQQAETLPFEPDLDHTSVGKSEMTFAVHSIVQ